MLIKIERLLRVDAIRIFGLEGRYSEHDVSATKGRPGSIVEL
jgi:hypothetical protein